MKKIGLVLLLVCLPAQVWAFGLFSPSYSIAIRQDSVTHEDINNISVDWGKLQKRVGGMFPGQGRTDIFPVSDIDDIYGDVYLTWENGAGQKFEKRFTFTRADAPPEYFAKKGGKRVIFEFWGGDRVDFYTGLTPGAAERGKASGKIQYQLRREWKAKYRH